MGLTLLRGSGLDLASYTNVDYAGKPNERLSASGTVINPGGAATSCVRDRQRCATLSTAEAKYVALGEGAEEA